jgi:hypothetical protein
LLLPRTTLQFAFGVELVTRAQVVAAAVLNEFRHDSGRLSVWFEGGRKAGRADSPLSNDEEVRAQSMLMAAFTRLSASLDVDMNMSGEGTKYIEPCFARVRVAVSNRDTDVRLLGRIAR